MYHPFNFNEINLSCGTYTPSVYHGKNNAAFMYWERSLYQRMESLFEFDLPWDAAAVEFFYFCLYRFGHVACFNSEQFGFTFQPGYPTGQGWFYQPTQYDVSNGNADFQKLFTIGEDAQIIRLCSDWYGAWDIIDKYASRLAEMETSLLMAIQNSRLAWILGAKNKGIAEALKKIYDKIQSGESLVILDKIIFNDKQDTSDPSPFQFLERKSVKDDYLVTQILSDMQSIIMEFDAEVGLPCIPYQKKERMVSDEATSKIEDGQARYSAWYENLKETMDNVNALFGTSLSVKKVYEQEEVNNEQIQDNTDRP